MADLSQTQWATALLKRLNITPTSANTRALVGWAKAEGGHWNNRAQYNPLNTTQNMPGAGNTGSQGNIKVYKNWQQGLDATVKTLENGRYGSILNALKSGNPDAVGSAINSSPWGTHNNIAGIIRAVPSTVAPSASSIGYQPSSPKTVSAAPAVASTAVASGGIDGDTKKQLLLAYLSQRGDPNALLSLASGLSAAGSASPATTAAVPSPTAAPSTPVATGGAGGAGGAQAALSWAESKVGKASSKETGTNSGGLASYANKRFGFSNAPWCAMFTSLAVSKGGAPSSARTASVAAVRQKANAGQGYERGLINPKAAKAGDLILFGNDHIGLVQSVSGGRITYIGGNQSDSVTEASVPVGKGDIVRPKYRR